MGNIALNSAAGRWVMASTIMASAMAFIDATALNVVLPALQRSMGATGAQLFWVLNAYLLMLAALILIGGALGDKLGRKKIFMIGIAIFIFGSAACGLSGTIALLIIFRVIQGIGGALMIPGSLSLITSSINDKERGSAIGTWSAVTTLVTMGGPILGGVLADAGLWRYIFFINVPIGIIALLILATKVAENKDEEDNGKIDYLGAVLIACGLALLTFGFLRMPEKGFRDPFVYGSIIGGIVFMLAFIRAEQKSSNPMMPLSLFRNRTFSGCNLLTLFLYAGLNGGMLFLSLNMIQVQGYTQTQSGLSFLPFTVLMILIARVAGGLADKWGPRLFLTFGPMIAGTGLLMLSLVDQTNGYSDYWSTFFPGICVLGLGMSFTVAPLTATVMGSLPDHLSGIASGTNNAISRIAGVFAVAIFGALVSLFFINTLMQQLHVLNLDTTAYNEIMAQAANLGNAKVPDNIPASEHAAIVTSYHKSFINAYQKIMLLAGILGYAGGLTGFIFIRRTQEKS
ncbi:MFS transporter [Chitinophaga silvatica]|uniref:MFS transporter n=1 Tax=Chitinophaga silvatica TaxID=2282649 RepID=A0A3E1Y8R2_9BACT|nr:MFS transporter [Chitinophaga silvatica]RFS21797.1 MFS transporter [Chitinophaga silvatica]